MREVKWWARWWVRYFPGHAIRRLLYCRSQHQGPWLDGVCCMTCAAPWFGNPSLRPATGITSAPLPPPVDLWDAVQRHLEQLPATDDE